MRNILKNNTVLRIIGVIFIGIAMLLSINQVSAQTVSEVNSSSITLPSGLQCQDGDLQSCTTCQVFIFTRDLFNFTLQFLTVLAVLSVGIGSAYILTAKGDSSLHTQGIHIIQYAAIVLLLSIASFIITNTLLVALGFQSMNEEISLVNGDIFQVLCSTIN